MYLVKPSGWSGAYWIPRLEQYIESRYSSIEERLSDTFRYVELAPENTSTFSYEFSGILRDAGSVFDSFMASLLEGVGSTPTRTNFNIEDYAIFFDDLRLETLGDDTLPSTNAGVSLRGNLGRRYLFPLQPMIRAGPKPSWWGAYNDLKHSDIDNQSKGNLGNCLSALGALAILHHLIAFPPPDTSNRLFRDVGIYVDEDPRQVFPTGSDSST